VRRRRRRALESRRQARTRQVAETQQRRRSGAAQASSVWAVTGVCVRACVRVCVVCGVECLAWSMEKRGDEAGRRRRRRAADVDGYGMWAALAGTTEAPTNDHVGQGQVPTEVRKMSTGSKNRPAAL
jgi:hypothetical protein